jgi:predicted hydrocarbon binding protein
VRSGSVVSRGGTATANRGGLHGLIFISLAEFLAARDAGDDPPTEYVLERAYPDAEFAGVLERAAGRLNSTPEDTLREFGRFLGTETFPRLAPAFYERHQSLTDALLAVEEEIHERVREVIPDALPPRLHVSALGSHGAVIAYTSERRLCALLEGLVEGSAARFGVAVRLEQPQCMLRGEPVCSIVVEVV